MHNPFPFIAAEVKAPAGKQPGTFQSERPARATKRGHRLLSHLRLRFPGCPVIPIYFKEYSIMRGICAMRDEIVNKSAL
jgi:hypothetical protein